MEGECRHNQQRCISRMFVWTNSLRKSLYSLTKEQFLLFIPSSFLVKKSQACLDHSMMINSDDYTKSLLFIQQYWEWVFSLHRLFCSRLSLFLLLSCSHSMDSNRRKGVRTISLIDSLVQLEFWLEPKFIGSSPSY